MGNGLARTRGEDFALEPFIVVLSARLDGAPTVIELQDWGDRWFRRS
jgi:hypothetical protein